MNPGRVLIIEDHIKYDEGLVEDVDGDFHLGFDKNT